KVIALVNKEDITLTSVLSHQGRGGNAVINDYQKFALEYFDFLATLNKSGMKAVTERYQRAGLKIHILYGLKKIINSVIRAEIKRILAKKPLPSEKQEKMATQHLFYVLRIPKHILSDACLNHY
ncbi:MAG: hypothetical protein OEZ20_09350, partial [candidate division WOR-3 bacterium]|nr:hypothetical protein [candidate division WOR-3 bacterium]